MSEHTPGPWLADAESADDRGIWILTDNVDRLVVADVLPLTVDALGEEAATANAHLIAAAPDLYTAAQDLERALAACPALSEVVGELERWGLYQHVSSLFEAREKAEVPAHA